MTALPYRRSRIVSILALLLTMAIPIANQFDVDAATDLVLGADAQITDAQGDNVNLRDEPSYAGNVITSVPEGWLVNVVDGPFTDDSDGTIWYQVVGDGQTGYMLAQYLDTPDESVTAAAVATTTARVNLRSGPGSTYGVLLVIPNGATINTTGLVQNGFTQLTYDGTTGWSASQYLSITSVETPAIVASGPLNLRSGPATTYSVLATMPTGASLTITGAVTNGFYPVRYDGTAGYASAEFIGIVTNRTATVINGSLNLRSGPASSYSVLLVMPNRATVTITGSVQNGFYPVTYNGTSGYASATYLRIDGTPPVSIPAWTTVGLNLRSGPSSSNSVLLVIPSGAQITITGSLQNGFYPVTYNGTSGFASATYITTSPGATPTPTATATPVNRAAWTTASLRLRSAASSTADVLVVIPNGSQIIVTGNLTNGFYPVTYGSTTGFASSTYITFTAPGVTPTPTTPSGNYAIVWPISGGTWEVLQGYNGSSHQNNSSTWQYLYSLDIHKTTGATAGTQVYSPVSGTVRWYERSSGGITIDMGNGYAFAMFHLTVDRAWEPGDTISQGDYIGTVSDVGGEGYQEIPHIHLTLWQTNDGGNWNRVAVPFTGQYTISGTDLPSDGSAYQWSGLEFTP